MNLFFFPVLSRQMESVLSRQMDVNDSHGAVILRASATACRNFKLNSTEGKLQVAKGKLKLKGSEGRKVTVSSSLLGVKTRVLERGTHLRPCWRSVPTGEERSLRPRRGLPFLINSPPLHTNPGCHRLATLSR